MAKTLTKRGAGRPKNVSNQTRFSEPIPETFSGNSESVSNGTRPGAPAAGPPEVAEVEPDLNAEVVEVEAGDLKGRSKTGLPIPPRLSLTFDEMVAYVLRFSESDWSHVVVYFTDKYPVCKRKYKYFTKLSRAFDLKYIQNVLGSGTYKIDVNDRDIPGTRQTIARCMFVLRDDAYPPKRNLEEVLMHDPANKDYVDWLKRTGQVTNEGNIVLPGASNDAVLNKLVDHALGVNKPVPPGNDALVMILQKQIEEQRKETAEFRRMWMEGMLNKPAGDPALTHVLAMMTSQLAASEARATATQQQMHELTIKTMELSARSNGGGKDMGLLGAMDLLDRIEERAASRKGDKEAETDPWAKLGEQALPIVGSLVETFIAKSTAAASPVHSQQQQQTQEQLPHMPIPEQQQQQEPDITFADCVKKIKPAIPYVIDSILDGEEGDAFAERMVKGYGLDAYDGIAIFDSPMLYRALMSDPRAAEKLKGNDGRVVTWVDAFVAYGVEDEQPEEQANKVYEMPAASEGEPK